MMELPGRTQVLASATVKREKLNSIAIDPKEFYRDATPEALARALLRPTWRDRQVPPPPIPDRLRKRDKGEKRGS